MVNARKRRHIIDIRRPREHQSPSRLLGRIRKNRAPKKLRNGV